MYLIFKFRIFEWLFFKMLINSSISLILNENTTDMNASSTSYLNTRFDTSYQLPIEFSKALIKLVGRYLTAQKDLTNLEQLFGNTISITQGSTNGLTYLLYFLLPLILWCSSGRKDSPTLNACDVSFLMTNLLSLLKPTSKLVPNLHLQTPKPTFIASFDTSIIGQSSFYNKSARQLKDILTQSAFLGRTFALNVCMHFLFLLSLSQSAYFKRLETDDIQL